MFSNAGQVRAEGNLPASIEDGVIDPHLVKASIEVKKILTAEVYAEIENDDESEAFSECSIAEANLALCYAIPALNMETQGTGIVRAKGWDSSRSDLLSQNEVRKLQEYYRNVAMNLLAPFIPQSGESPDEIRGGGFRVISI